MAVPPSYYRVGASFMYTDGSYYSYDEVKNTSTIYYNHDDGASTSVVRKVLGESSTAAPAAALLRNTPAAGAKPLRFGAASPQKPEGDLFTFLFLILSILLLLILLFMIGIYFYCYRKRLLEEEEYWVHSRACQDTRRANSRLSKQHAGSRRQSYLPASRRGSRYNNREEEDDGFDEVNAFNPAPRTASSLRRSQSGLSAKGNSFNNKNNINNNNNTATGGYRNPLQSAPPPADFVPPPALMPHSSFSRAPAPPPVNNNNNNNNVNVNFNTPPPTTNTVAAAAPAPENGSNEQVSNDSDGVPISRRRSRVSFRLDKNQRMV